MKFFGLVGLISGLAMASSDQGGVGVGFVAGNPSGLSAKINSGINSINLIAGWDFNRHYSSFYVGGDYVWDYYQIPVQKGRLPLYVGPGLLASISSNPGFGVRAVVGVEYQFVGLPFDAFLELGPGLTVLPGLYGIFTGGIGARFFF